MNRRDFFHRSALATGGLVLAPWLQQAMGSPLAQKAPMRFIFLHKGNGLFPDVMVPPSLSAEDAAKERARESFSVDLRNHELPAWMAPIAAHKESLTILQGLSGMMCTTGHHTWQSSLGVYRANERPSSIKWATVDFELARLFPSPFEHIELACFPDGGGNSRGNIEGIDVGFSARGQGQPNYAFGSPKVALRELFKSVAADRSDQNRYALERKLHADHARRVDEHALAGAADRECDCVDHLLRIRHAARSRRGIRAARVQDERRRVPARVLQVPPRDLDRGSGEQISREDRGGRRAGRHREQREVVAPRLLDRRGAHRRAEPARPVE
jgi:hypothetical protein